MRPSPKIKKTTRIYRIIPFQRLTEILINKENSLVYPSIWEDPFEKWRLEKMSKIKKRYFGQCWTLHARRDMMWKIYSNGTDGFRIRTTIGDLLQSVNRHDLPGIIARVKYLGKKTIKSHVEDYGDCYCKDFILTDVEMTGSTLSTAKKFMIKRFAFIPENEMRLIHYRDGEAQGSECYRYKSSPNRMIYKICPNRMINQIMTHPEVSSDDHKALRSALRKIGFKNEIKPSELYNME